MSTFLLNKKYLPHRVGVCFIIGIIAGFSMIFLFG